jgi:hypothetical protein
VVERELFVPAQNAVLTRSHVATTDVIKELVITEEGSVAKGIRRLVAVTGHDAYEVQRKGKEFDAKLEFIRGLLGKDKEIAMKPFLTVGTNPIIKPFAYWTGTWSKQYLSRQEESAQGVF